MKIKTIALIATLTLPLAAWADDEKPGAYDSTDKSADTTKGEKLGDKDLEVLAHVHHVNQMEIDLGKLAQKQGSQAVKAYGQMLARDHQSADKDLTAFAKKNSVTIPMDRPKDESAQKDQKDMKDAMMHLKTLKGNDFDTAFLQMMVEGHEKELAKLDSAIGGIENQGLATMLKDIKPMLQKHADQARDLQKNNAQAMK
jgi:putative membrane protein